MPHDTNGLPPQSKLCYLDAHNVTLPAGVLADVRVVTADGEPVGTIAGVVIEPAARRVRYYDVRSSGFLRQRRRFVGADQLGQLDPERKVLRMLASDVVAVPPTELGDLHQFSDDDLLDAMFSPRAA